MTTAITPEVVGFETQVLEDSPMTESEEKELVIVKTAIKTAYADKLERDLAIGAGLLKIFRRKLYRGKEGGRTWEQWLAKESAELTAGRGPLGKDAAFRLRAFYRFRVEILGAELQSSAIPLPTYPKQVWPLMGQLDQHPEAAIEMWKAACADASRANPGKAPTYDQVNRAALAFKANEANQARRLSAAAQQRQERIREVCVKQTPSVSDAPSNEGMKELFDGFRKDYSPQHSATAPSPTIPAWELEKDDSTLDAATECKRITVAINDANKAIGLLRGILYSQINKHGSDYLNFLRQVDAGVYSLHNIDEQVQQMGEDISFISELLIADVGEGELAESTIDVDAFPTRA